MAKRRFSGSGAGPTERQLKVGELIRRALAEVFMRGDLHEPELANRSITVSEVRPSPDLRQATVYVLPLGGEGADEVIAALTRTRHELRREVNRRVSLKFSPELKFEIDGSFDRLDETRRMFSDPKVRQDLGEGE